MKCKVEIVCDNDAFTEPNASYEVARILRKLANEIEYADLKAIAPRSLLDINGNVVGAFDLE